VPVDWGRGEVEVKPIPGPTVCTCCKGPGPELWGEGVEKWQCECVKEWRGGYVRM